jgi:hypothetical protein
MNIVAIYITDATRVTGKPVPAVSE